MSLPDLKDYTLQELVGFAESLGLSAFRGRQIFSWLYRPGITDFSQMTDLSLKVRQQLAENATFSRLVPAVKENSVDGTSKYGFQLADKKYIESVLIPDEDRLTLCISSQVGCAMGCLFCKTATMGLQRNLTPAEIVNQVGAVIEDIRCAIKPEFEQGNRLINNIVFMGMGEPLANLDNVVKAINILTDQRGYNFSERRITVSTCGLVPRIAELGERTNVNLAISLHAIDDETRDRIMPVNKTFSIARLLQACRDFPLAKRRRIMFEYILIDGLNDAPRHAKKLAALLRNIRCKINLLPFNEVEGIAFKEPKEESTAQFQKILRDAGYTVIVRSSRGADISAACGQLADKLVDD